MNLLLASDNTGTLVLLIVLVAACIVLFVVNYIRNKKYYEQQKEMLNNITVGSKVLTKTFMYGTVEKITETTDGKILLIKSGEGDNVGYFEMNLEGIYSLDQKEEVVDVEDIDSNNEEEAVNESEESTVAFKAEETVETEKPKKRTTRKKKE